MLCLCKISEIDEKQRRGSPTSPCRTHVTKRSCLCDLMMMRMMMEVCLWSRLLFLHFLHFFQQELESKKDTILSKVDVTSARPK